MKLKTTVNFDFGKLANKLPKLIEDHTHRVAVSSADRAKEAIDSGKFEPLKDSTVEIRAKGQSPSSGMTKTSSIKPLVHTGRLRDSIKATKDGLEMLAYGQAHYQGGKTSNNKFTKQFNMVGKNRPARNFLNQGMKLARNDISKLTKTLVKKIKQAMHLSTPIQSS